jgi:hypothetical protein
VTLNQALIRAGGRVGGNYLWKLSLLSVDFPNSLKPREEQNRLFFSPSFSCVTVTSLLSFSILLSRGLVIVVIV